MSLYSDYSAARTRQIIADVVGLVMVIIVIAVASAVTAAIRTLGSFGRDLESAGSDFQNGLTDAADALGDVPLIGDGIRGPFDAAASAGAAVAEAGRGQQQFVEVVAVSTGWAVALVPLMLLALLWVMPRVRFARRSSALRRMIANGLSADTLAARAVAHAPLAQLVAVHPDPAAAWRANDPRLVRALAGIELRRAGIRPDALP
jgi:predicted small secreted protein